MSIVKIYIAVLTGIIMVFSKDEVSRFWTMAAILILGILVFLLLKPVLISVFAGLIFAYLFLPIYQWTLKWAKYKSLAASIVIGIILIIILIPLWYALPVLINQFFEVFKLSQTIDISSALDKLFPSVSNDIILQAGTTFTAFISKASASILSSMVNFFSEIPTLLLNLLVFGFVFFFGLRDSEELKKIAKEISPLNRAKEKIIVQQFKDITESILYGQFVIGIAQGLFAGIGFLVFGIDKALLLTILTILCSIIPILGPYIVYIPVAISIFASGNTGAGVAYLLYNIIIVSTLDNFLRTYIVSKKTKMNSAVVFVGMIGGLFMFGMVGLLIGPLILAYFLIILQLYKEKELSSLFVREEPIQESEKK